MSFNENVRKEAFLPGEYYHIYDRTIFNMPEFKDLQTSERLAQAFLLSNSTQSSSAFQFLRNHPDATIDKALRIARGGEKLVDVLCYVIMPDHYHLLVRELAERGISEFIRKCNISIAKYINTVKERRGPIFESRFKSKHINSDTYLHHLSLYIHLNPLDFIAGKSWREHDLKNWYKHRAKLLNYKWSSLNFYFNNIKNEIISGHEIITSQYRNSHDYESYLKGWAESDILSDGDILSDDSLLID
jgi:putative transposase